MHNNTIDLYNIKNVSDNYTIYEKIHISKEVYPDLKIVKAIPYFEEAERIYGYTQIEDVVYDKIIQKVQKTKDLEELMIKSIYNNAKIFYLI